MRVPLSSRGVDSVCVCRGHPCYWVPEPPPLILGCISDLPNADVLLAPSTTKLEVAVQGLQMSFICDI